MIYADPCLVTEYWCYLDSNFNSSFYKAGSAPISLCSTGSW